VSGSNATAVFSAHARDYDAPRRRLIPVFDAFYGAAVDALCLTHGPVRRVLDLGAGTGLLSAAVLKACPAAWRRAGSRTTHAADLQARPDAERRRSA
jgi:methylase of polypeptide subunit release factors